MFLRPYAAQNIFLGVLGALGGLNNQYSGPAVHLREMP